MSASPHDSNNGLTLPDHIETLFKAEAPFQPVVNGHGFMGILLLDKTEDKIQCHLCGGWFSLLAPHLKHKHSTGTNEYKLTHGLPMGFPLCARGVSARHSVRASRPDALAHLATVRNPEKATQKSRVRRKAFTKYARTNAAFLNKHGLCHDQILRRYLMVADSVGKEPSQRDLEQYDEALWAAIKRRHRNLNIFRKQEGFRIIKRHRIHNEDTILAAIRSKATLLKRLPCPSDFRKGSPTSVTILKHFGSWHRAFEMCGMMCARR